MGRNRSAVLELAVLGVLHRTPMHGYELRKQITSVLGLFRALSYGSLYPCLHELLAAGLIVEEHDEAQPARTTAAGRPRPGRRALKVYRLTAEGKERLQDLLGEGRRSRLEERMESIRAALTRTRERVDSYTLELHRHGLESVEREVRWLNELIASERQAGGPDNISDKESS